MKYLIAIGLLLLINPLLNFLPAYNEIKFAGTPILAAMLWWYYRPKIKWTDGFLFIFILFMALSASKASALSMVWQPFFTWSSTILLAIGLREWMAAEPKWLEGIIHISFISFTLWISYGILFAVQTTYNPAWVDFAGRNRNFCATIPILYSTPLLLKTTKKWWLKILQLLGLAVLWWIADFQLSALGIGLVILLAMAWLIRQLPESGINNLPLISLTFLVLFPAIWTFTDVLDPIWGKLSSYAMEVDDRWYEVRLSWVAFKQHPLLGVGIGNWYNDVFEYLPLLHSEATPSFSTNHIRPHFFLLALLAEIGIIGWLGFVLPFAGITIMAFRNRSFWKSAAYPYHIAILLTFATFFTLRPSVSSEQNFSAIPLYLMVGYAFLTRDLRQLKGFQWNIRPWVLGFCLPAVVWSCFWFYANHLYLKSILLSRMGEVQQSITLLEKIYHPIFRTVVGQDMYPIDRLLAGKYARLGNREKALFHCQRGYEAFPYHSKFALFYADYLSSSNPEKADSIRMQVHALHNLE